MSRWLSFLVMTAFALGCLACNDPPPGYTGVPPSYFGMHIHRATDDGYWPGIPFGSLRMWDQSSANPHWPNLQPHQGSAFIWTAIDETISTASAHGVDLVYTLGRIPTWASTDSSNSGCYLGNGACGVPDLTAWDAFLTAIATHAAGRIKYWELWNEPNDPRFFSGQISDMVTLAQHAHDIIKGVDPNAQLLTPAPVGASGITWMGSYLAAGGGKYADIIAFHGYSGSVPETVSSTIDSFMSVIQGAGQGGKPVWDTESSWATLISDPDQQAAYLARSYLLQWSKGISRFYWYAWDDPAWGTLLTAPGATVPAATAYQQVYEWMVGATLSSPCSEDKFLTWSCTFTRPGNVEAVAMWNLAPSGLSYIPPSDFTLWRDLNGNHTWIDGTAIQLGPKPILLEKRPNHLFTSPR